MGLIASTVIRAIFYLAVLVVIVRQLKYCERIAEPIALIVWTLHGLIYCAWFIVDYSIDGRVVPVFYNFWNIALSLHIVGTILVIEDARLRRMRKKNGC